MLQRISRVSLLFPILFLLGPLHTRASEPLQYELRFERPNTHLMDVTIRATGLSGSAVEFAIPDWAPGSYYLENYAANVQRFRAHGSSGNSLRWRKTDSQAWQVELSGAKEATIEYQVYANTLQNNIAQYDERHAFIGGPSVWMYLVGGKDRPIALSIAVPTGWKVATGMNRTSDQAFSAINYDWFADAPLEISDFTERDFQVLGTTYHVIIHNVEGGKDPSRFVADLQKAVATIVPIFQPVVGGEQAAPFKEYYFLFHIWPKTGGGLEHLNSTQIDYSSDWDSMAPTDGYGSQYDLKLFVAAHEFFHAWNVKRLRPRPLGPFDYEHMVHTPSLWISEGLTSYYGYLCLERAGLITPQQYLDGIARLITKFEQEPGRTERSIEDTSWDTWFNRNTVKQDNNLQNTTYSYYDGGQIMGHILDFAIRQNTKNQKSLDDWMRLMYSRYALPKAGFEPQEAIEAASEIAGTDMGEIFSRYISGKDNPIPYEKYFAYAGVSVEKKLNQDAPWLGVETEKGDDGRAVVRNVIPNSPADAGGLDRLDEVFGLDGRAVDFDGFTDAVSRHKPGDAIHITVLRLAYVKDIAVSLSASPYYTYTLKPMANPSVEQKAIYNSWLGLK